MARYSKSAGDDVKRAVKRAKKGKLKSGRGGNARDFMPALLFLNQLFPSNLIAVRKLVGIKRPLLLRNNSLGNINHLLVGLSVRDRLQRSCDIHDLVAHAESCSDQPGASRLYRREPSATSTR